MAAVNKFNNAEVSSQQSSIRNFTGRRLAAPPLVLIVDSKLSAHAANSLEEEQSNIEEGKSMPLFLSQVFIFIFLLIAAAAAAATNLQLPYCLARNTIRGGLLLSCPDL
jgi:hypothetical protein